MVASKRRMFIKTKFSSVRSVNLLARAAVTAKLPTVSKTEDNAAKAYEAEVRKYFYDCQQQLRTSRVLRKRAELEFDGLVYAIQGVQKATDPYDPDYIRAISTAQKEGWDYDVVEYRTNMIAFDQLIERFVMQVEYDITDHLVQPEGRRDVHLAVLRRLRRLLEVQLDGHKSMADLQVSSDDTLALSLLPPFFRVHQELSDGTQAEALAAALPRERVYCLFWIRFPVSPCLL